MSARQRPSLRTLALVVAALALAAGCQVRTDVNVRVRRDGSGTVAVTVSLDREAAEQIPNLENQLRVEDLRRAGWRLVGVKRTTGGGLRVSARKRFGRPGQLAAVLAEVAGKDGPFQGFAITRSHSFARTSWSVRGSVDLSKGLAAFSDQRVTALLGGNPFGRSEDELRFLARGSVAAAAPIRVTVRLPGGAVRTYSLRLGDSKRTIDAKATEPNTSAYLLAAAAVLTALAALVLFALGGGRRRPRAERGMGAYDRRRYEAISEIEEGPPPGTGGPPELVRIHRPAKEEAEEGWDGPDPIPRRSGPTTRPPAPRRPRRDR